MSARNWFLAGSLFLASGAALTAAASGSDLLDALLQRPSSSAGTVIVPDPFLRRWDPITVFHASRKGTEGPEDHPERFVQLDPAHPGAWTWLDAKTLQFRPAEPWPPMTMVTVRGEGARQDLFTLAAPPTRTSPRQGSTTRGPVDRIEMTFSEEVPLDALARATTIQVRPLPGLSDDGLVTLGPDDFEVKQLMRDDAQSPVTVALVLHEPIERGSAVTVDVGLAIEADAEEARYRLAFRTPEPFRAVGLGCRGQRQVITASGTRYPSEQPLRCTGGRTIEVAFNAPPAGVGPIEARNLVRFAPAVDDLDVELSGEILRIRGSFEDDQLYRVSLHPTPILDRAERSLDLTGESAVHVLFPRQSPFVRWGSGAGLLERYGPHRIPVEGRGVEQADVRIYTVDPFNRELWPFPSRPVAIDEDARPPGPGEEPARLAANATVDEAGLRRRLASLGSPAFSGLLDLPLTGRSGRAGLDLTSALAGLSGARSPGHYLVGLRRLDGGRERSWMRIQVTDLSLTTFEGEDEVEMLVTSLATGRPVAGAKVRLEGVVSNGGSPKWVTRYEATADGAGRIRWKVPGQGGGDVRRVSVRKGDDVLVLDGTRPPEAFENGTWRNRRGGWLSWAFHDLDGRKAPVRELGHLFPERPVFRPEEPVHLKGYVRRQEKGRLSVVRGRGTLEIQGPGATWSLPVTLSELGSFYAAWDESDLPTGTYTARYVHQDGRTWARTSFRVEAYRLPTFEIDLEGPENRRLVPNDRSFEVRATASYYAGGNVAGRPIRWSVTQFPFAWAPDGPEGFRYSSDGRYSRARRFDSTPALDRRDTTSTKGRASLELDPGIEPTAQPRTYIIEATVTDADEQTVTATHRIDAVPAFVLGLKVPRHVPNARTLPIEAVVVGPDGALLTGQDVTVRVLHRQWHSVLQASDFSDGVARYVTDVVDVPVMEERLTSGDAPTALRLPVDQAGVYVVELEARDALGRVQVVTTDLFAGGTGDVTWAKPEAGVFEITSTQTSWKPGDTARLVLQSPFRDGFAIAAVETPTGLRYHTVDVRGGKAVLSIPVERGWVPKVPVHVLLRRGRLEDAGTLGGADLGKPETLASTHWLTVDPVENTVAVELTHPERAMPGETLPVTVELTDPEGRPLAGEVALWLVDQAVLALGDEQRLDPRPDFIRARTSQARARDTRGMAFGTLPFKEMPGGDGEEEMDEEAEDLLDQTAVRKNFKSVPYYEAALSIPASGRRTVQVELPDNLTVFRVRAKAISGAERFGVGTSSVRVRLPVVLQPDLPRFVRPGDRLDVGALARVVEGEGGPGSAKIEVDGLELRSEANRSLAWSTDTAAALGWPVEVPTPEEPEAEVRIKVAARRSADGAADAVEVMLPVRPDRRARHRRQIVGLDAGDTTQLAGLEEKVRTGTLERTVVIADHPGMVKMAAGMDVLVGRRARSAGQHIDRARAWLAMGELRETLGMGQDLVDTALREAFDSLTTAVDSRGLVAAWPGGTGRVGLTADALELLVDAREAGHTVDPGLEANLVRALKRATRSDFRGFVDGASWYERSRALAALARSGQFSEPTFTELGSHARQLGTLGKSNILLAASSAGRADGTLARELARDLQDDVVIALYQGKERYQGLQSLGGWTSPFVPNDETYTVATMTRCLLAAQPTSPTTEHLVDALVRLGGEDGWGGRADAPALLALAKRLADRPEGTITVQLDGQTVRVEGATRHVLSGTNDVAVTHTDGPDAALYARTRWVPALPGSRADAVREGFVVARTLRQVADGQPGTRQTLDEGGREVKMPAGQVVEDHVQVTTPEDHAMVAITVPLAAGLEPLNPALRTAPPEARPSTADTRSATWTVFGDDSITYYFEWLPKGTYDFRFRARATTSGRFVQPPASAELLYEPAVYGQSPGAWVVVE